MKHCLQTKRKLKAKVKVSDDWYPNFPNSTVQLTYNPKNGHLSLWGDDDFGMEKTGTREEFEKLKGMTIDKKKAKELGFQPA